MADETFIANLCLGRLKVGQVIADLDEESTPAQTCARFFDQCRQEVLRAYPWGCSLRAEALALVAGETFPGWQYVYQYPSNCLMVRCVADEGGMRQYHSLLSSCRWDDAAAFNRRQPWKTALKSDSSSQIILSDVPNAWAFLTDDLDNVVVFPADLASSLAWRLAMEVGGPLQADTASVDRAAQWYGASISMAAAQSMNESKDDPIPDSPSIQCRM